MIRALALAALLFAAASCAPKERPMQTVTRENFVRAETDTYFAGFVREGAFGRLSHSRELTDVAHQTVVRSNRDTLYSRGVFDLDAGPVTVTLPDAGGRFMSLLVISEDHYNPAAVYDAKPHTFTRDEVGTRYMAVLLRTFVDPDDPADLAKVHALQDAVQVRQAAPGVFEIPAWGAGSLAKVREDLKQEAGFDPRRAFGAKGEVDPRDHLIGTARGWGGNPPKDATYVSGQAPANDGVTVHRLTLRDVPVDGFWSISVYNKDGFFEPNAGGAYSLNNVTAKPGPDGAYAIQFGGCDDAVANCLPITPGWNYTVRLYRPRQAILDGSWKVSEAQPVA